MRIIVSAEGESLDAPASPVFGRCPTYILVDTATGEYRALPNPAMNQGGGAGIQAAQFVVEQGVQAVLTGNLGPNAFDVLQAADIPAYMVSEGTVRQAVEGYKAQRLQPMGGANVAAHAGMGRGAGRGNSGAAHQPATASLPAQGTAAESDQELAQLGETLKALRQQLAETMDRIQQLERNMEKGEA
ncbi:MAG: NifB/NifX family molybdenum-iron cluster-binding protein [Anaerolineae bacterium]|jgi:predicted Fe-Mo cluster-binding NifX family protein|nr:NifB/NifX family molybdenum-iron cluster-binding protein [Anaerolineae bacterium]